jgi:xylulokinase
MGFETILGIDVGTTSVKGIVLGVDGSKHVAFGATYPTSRPAMSRVEQNPQDWLARIDAALADFTARGSLAGVQAIGLTSQVNTHVFLDVEARPLIPAITWADTRAAAEAAELDARLTVAQKIAWLGAPMPIDASHALARMLWVSRHQPEIWERTRWVVLPKDYCLHHLTGTMATDPQSNIGLTNREGYIAEVLALVSGAAERMAPLAAPQAVMGQGRPGGPLAGLPVVTGTMDGWCALYGAGGSAEGAGVHVSGTSEVLGIASATVHPTPGVIVFDELAGLRLHAGPTQAGGAALAWFCSWAGISAEAASDLVSAHPRTPLTPLFLPHLQGERAPLWDPSLRGVLLGMDSASSLPDLARAVMEGVALSACHVIGALEASSGHRPAMLTCGGGGFRSDIWLQIKADVLGRPLARLSINEPGLIGAAALAALGAGLVPDLRSAQQSLAQFEPPVAPDPAKRTLYDDLFGIYTDAITANAALNARLLALASHQSDEARNGS